jgi:hypothetical protein
MDKQTREIIRAISTWIEVAEQWGYTVRVYNLLVDADHSSLLRRILDGKKVHDVPPPVSYSYPNYALLDDGVSYAEEVWERDGFESLADGGMPVVIEQTVWKGLERLPDGWIARYPMGHGDKRQWSKKYLIVKDGDKKGPMGKQQYKITEYSGS